MGDEQVYREALWSKLSISEVRKYPYVPPVRKLLFCRGCAISPPGQNQPARDGTHGCRFPVDEVEKRATQSKRGPAHAPDL